MSNALSHTILIKNEAKRLGFFSCGITGIEPLKKEEEWLNNWLDNGLNGNMQFFRKQPEIRANPGKLIENAKSVICVSHNYYPGKVEFSLDKPIISKYALVKDYHVFMKKKLHSLFEYINNNIKPVRGKVFVDSAPIFEKALAARAGLGWIGKNTLLINRHIGSYFFLGELFIDLELDYDEPETDHCGSCKFCIEACPIQAIIEPRKLDARRCISYLTIENKENIPEKFRGKLKNHIFGCDLCQDICPWNSKAIQNEEPDFKINEKILSLNINDWYNLSETKFNQIAKDSPIIRCTYSKIKKNLEFIMN